MRRLFFLFLTVIGYPHPTPPYLRSPSAANFYTGCTGGRQEAAFYATLEQESKALYGERVHFVTNLVQSSTATNCEGWMTFTNTEEDATFKPTILYSDNGGSSSVGSKHLSYTFYDNLHPQYMIIDGNEDSFYYESSDVAGPKFTRNPTTNSYVDGTIAETECDGTKTSLTYWNVEKCLHRGFDKVKNALASHIASLPTSCANTNTGSVFDCSSHANDINASPGSIKCADQSNGCLVTECCTIVPTTCANTNAGTVLDCSNHANDLNASPGSITCADQSSGCLETECCTVVPLKTCADITGSTGGAFDCSGHANAIHGAPGTITCTQQGSGCVAAECCTVAPSATKTCANTNSDSFFDCSSHANDINAAPTSITCNDQTNGCIASECCTVVPKTCANTNAGNVFSCSSHANDITAAPTDITCNDQTNGCSATECCTVVLKTCANTNSGSLFDCSSHANDINSAPADILCSAQSSGCIATECCTVVPCIDLGIVTHGSLDVSVPKISCVPSFGKTTSEIRTIASQLNGKLYTPRDLQFHPVNKNELWVANQASSDISILTFTSTNEIFSNDLNTSRSFQALKVADRAKYHYMASVSAFSFGADGRFATCQESLNTYDGLTATGGENGNKFMGPTLFESDANRRVTSMGKLNCDSSKETCFLRHIDMLHESPLCMGIVHDPEIFSNTCGNYGHATVQKNVFWSFDGYGKGDQVIQENQERKGMLMRYDFERDHGGCNSYLCADHGEAEVRRYEDVILTRVPNIPSHIAFDTKYRDLWIADTGGARILRVDADSGRSDRTAIYEYPIYSSTHLHFNYKIWKCTRYETLIDQTTAGMLPEDKANFQPSGVVMDDAGMVYVSNFATGNILAIDKYHGTIVKTLQTGRINALAGLEIHTDNNQYLFVLDQNQGELLRISKQSSNGNVRSNNNNNNACEDSTTNMHTRIRRPYPTTVGDASAICKSSFIKTDAVATVGDAIVHDPGYMNIAIPKDYGMDVETPCHDPISLKSNYNLDALLMAGHTCHRCLPNPCHNGGTCTGVQENGFSCTCKEHSKGDMCQICNVNDGCISESSTPSPGTVTSTSKEEFADAIRESLNSPMGSGGNRKSLTLPTTISMLCGMLMVSWYVH